MDDATGTPPTAADIAAWNAAGVRRQWLQRWVERRIITSAQAVMIDRADGLAAAEIGQWGGLWVQADLVTPAQQQLIQHDLSAALGGAVAPPPAAPVAPTAPAHASTPIAPAPAYAPAPIAPAGPTAAPTAGGGSGSALAIVAELLGYLGAALAIGGAWYLMRGVWPDIPVGLQLLFVIVVAGILTMLGALVKSEGQPAFVRLRTVTWLASTAVTGAIGAVIAIQVLDTTYPPTVIGWTGLFVAAQSAALWQYRDRPFQQATFLIGVIAAVDFGLASMAGPGISGFVTLALGAGLVALGATRVVRAPIMTASIGVIGCYVALSTAAFDTVAGALLVGSALVAAMLVLVSVRGIPRSTPALFPMVVGGGFGLITVIPLTVLYFAFEASVVTGSVLILVGLVFLTIALVDLCHEREPGEILGMLLAFSGAAVTGATLEGVAPLLGLVLAVAFLSVGFARRRLTFIIGGWVGLAIFGIWEVWWLRSLIDIGAILAVAVGVIVVAVAVVLSRRFVSRSGPQDPPG